MNGIFFRSVATGWLLLHLSLPGRTQAITLPVDLLRPGPAPEAREFRIDDTTETPAWSVFESGGTVFVTDSFFEQDAPLPFTIDLSVADRFPVTGARHVLQVRDGFLVGWNRGEWGGRLSWFAADGKRSYEIRHANVIAIIARDTSLLLVEGLAHLSMDEGHVYQLRKSGDQYAALPYLELPAAPRIAAIAPSGDLILLTGRQVLAIDPAGTLRTILSDPDWADAAWPNTIAFQGNTAFIGMGSAVLRVGLRDGKSSWLCPPY